MKAGCTHQLPQLDAGERMLSGRGVERLRRQLMVRLPLERTISGAAWEEILAGGLHGQAVGTGVRGGGKHLFDVLKGRAGFSAKTLNSQRIALEDLPGAKSFWFVLRRSDIIRHGEKLTAGQIGRRLVDDFNNHRASSADSQMVEMTRMALLLRSSDERQHLYWETECCALDRDAISWQWTDQQRLSVTGSCSDCEEPLYRYFLSGTQLFGSFPVPESAKLIRTPYRELDSLPTEELYRLLYS